LHFGLCPPLGGQQVDFEFGAKLTTFLNSPIQFELQTVYLSNWRVELEVEQQRVAIKEISRANIWPLATEAHLRHHLE